MSDDWKATEPDREQPAPLDPAERHAMVSRIVGVINTFVTYADDEALQELERHLKAVTSVVLAPRQ